MFFRLPGTTATQIESGDPEPLDQLVSEAPADAIFERGGIQVAFSTMRRGDELVFRANAQNTWTEARQVRFIISPKRLSGRGKIPKSEFSAQMAGGEVGVLELVLPIPDAASGRFQFFCSLRVSGKGGGHWLRAKRRLLPEHVETWQTVLIAILTLGRYFTWGGGIAFEHQIEASDALRIAPAPHGTYTQTRPPPASLEIVALSKSTMSPAARRTALIVVLLAIPAAAIALWIAAHPDVFVVNAFDYPVTIVVDGRTEVIPPRSVRPLSLSLGTFDAKAFDDRGAEIEAVSIAARPPQGTIIWNLAGEAPVYAEEVIYGSGKPFGKLFCGKSLLHFSMMRQSDLFREPPEKGKRGTTRLHVDVLDMNDPKNDCR